MPVVLTTGYAEAAIREAAREGFRMLRKPYDIQALKQMVGEIFDDCAAS